MLGDARPQTNHDLSIYKIMQLSTTYKGLIADINAALAYVAGGFVSGGAAKTSGKPPAT